MLVKLMPDYVKEHWDFLSLCVLYSLPEFAPRDEKLKARLFKSCMDGSLEMWTYTKEDDAGNPVLHIVGTTMIQGDPTIGNRDLLIYTFYLLNECPEEYWQDALGGLIKYAYAQQCNFVTAYTKRPRIVNFLRKMPHIGEISYFTLPVAKAIEGAKQPSIPDKGGSS